MDNSHRTIAEAGERHFAVPGSPLKKGTAPCETVLPAGETKGPERGFQQAAGGGPLQSAPSPSTGKFCIVGAGSSGLAVAKCFLAAGVAFDCLEREDDVGGNWYYGRPHSSVYQSTRLISSKRETQYPDFPMPDDWPEHPGHELVWRYLRDYARHFRLYEHIEFNTGVAHLEPVGDAAGGWDVRLASGQRRRYRGVVIANGHNWDRRWPDYAGRFDGVAIHSADYKTPEICRGRRVLVVGGGNSGFDIAVDVAPHAAVTLHSLRRGYQVLPRFFQGVPVDQCGAWMLRWRLPLWVRRLAAARTQRLAWRDVAGSLPRPDHRLFETHPVINARWPHDVAGGTIAVKPDVRELDGDGVVFTDGSREPVDLIIYATGYKLSFPFIDRGQLNWHAERPELYLHIFHPERDDLFVAGLIQPDSGVFGLFDYQAQLIAAYVRGLERRAAGAIKFQSAKRGKPPRPSAGIRYVRSPRHLVEVEHASYRRALQRWIGQLS